MTVTGLLFPSGIPGAVGVGGKTITFDGTGADNLPDVITNDDGTFTAQGPAPNTVTTGWKVQAHFAGDSSLGASDSVIKSYNTLKHGVSLVVSAAASSIPWGKPTSFTATLKDASLGGVPIEGKTIMFTGNGIFGNANGGNVISDANGKAVLRSVAPDTVATGWTYQAHFAGDSLYTNKDSTVKTYRYYKACCNIGCHNCKCSMGSA